MAEQLSRKIMGKLDRKKIILIVTGIVGASLIVVSGFIGKNNKKSVSAEYTDCSFYTDYLEDKIEELCLGIDGITYAKVFLTLECSSEYVYTGEGASDYLILSKDTGEEAVMIREIYPKVRGIAVVCTGGDLPRIKETVTELLSASLGLPYNKIKVAGG